MTFGAALMVHNCEKKLLFLSCDLKRDPETIVNVLTHTHTHTRCVPQVCTFMKVDPTGEPTCKLAFLL